MSSFSPRKRQLKHAALMQNIPNMEHDDPKTKNGAAHAKSEISGVSRRLALSNTLPHSGPSRGWDDGKVTVK